MRYKGRYVAQIELDFDVLKQEGMLPFEELKKRITGGELTNVIKEVIVDEIFGDYGTVTITQQYANIYEVEENVSE